MSNLLLTFSLFATFAAQQLHAQGMGASVGYSFGLIRSDLIAQRGFSNRMFSSGPSFGIDIIKGVAFSLRYDRFSAHDSYDMEAGGKRHVRIDQSLGKFMIGYGFCDPEKGMLAVQFGFTIGHETARFSREYHDGTISYGMDDPHSGTYESFRALPPLLAISGGYALTPGVLVYAHVERNFKKGFGDSEFHDWHFQKETVYAVSAGGSSPYTYLGNNDLSAWRCELGFKFMFGI